MTNVKVIDLTAEIDRRGIRGFHISLLILSMFIMLTDGFDVAATAYVGRVLVKEWGLQDAALGPLLGAGFLGGIMGPAILGYISDRVGRKYSTILGTASYGLFTLLQVYATNIDQMIVLRFIAGIGISGIVSTVIPLNAEYAPRHLQATMAILAFLGIAFGGLGAAMYTTLGFVTQYGWHSVFWIGGLAPLAAALIGVFVFPESVKFLSLQPARRKELLRTVRRFLPDAGITDDVKFVIGGEINQAKFRFQDLFKGRLATITPLLWILNIFTLGIYFFISQWTPTLLSGQGYTLEQASRAGMALQLGNIAGALLIIRPMGKWGYWPITLACAVIVPFIALIGWQGIPLTGIIGSAFVAGFGIACLQFGNIAAENQVYPTYIRSWGVGAAFAWGRGGSVVGPIMGGIFLGMHVPVSQLFLLAAGCMAINFIATLLFSPQYAKRMRELAQGREAA